MSGFALVPAISQGMAGLSVRNGAAVGAFRREADSLTGMTGKKSKGKGKKNEGNGKGKDNRGSFDYATLRSG